MDVKTKIRRMLLVSFVFVFSFFAAASVQAATSFSGTLPAGTTTLTKAGGPYLLTEVQVLAGSTLVIEPGTVVKLNGTFVIYTYGGTVTIGAPGAEKVILTSLYDDSVGGDTDGGGPSTPHPGDWCSIGAGPGGSLSITNAEIRYGSCTGGYAQVYNNGGEVTVTDTILSEGGYMDFLQAAGTGTVTHSELTGTQVGVRYHKGALTLHDNSIHDNTTYGLNNTSLAHTVIDATNNWWGSDTGPFHATLNPGGLGNNAVSSYVLFDPWLHVNPLEDIPLCTENCYSSILFLPGLQASRLYGDGGKLWEPGSDSDVQKLFLDTAGKSQRNDIVTRDVIDNAYLPVKGNIYESFLADLAVWKNDEHLIDDYAITPYDWRLTLAEILSSGKKTGDDISYLEPTDSPFILSELRRLASTSQSGKVTIVAHSNGGLVAKALTDRLGAEAASLIDTIVFVGVPQNGTPQAIGAILHGYDQGLPIDWFPFAMDPKTARTFANNMPSAYHLLPSQNYFNGEGAGVETPVITFKDGSATHYYTGKYGEKIDTFSELHDFLMENEGKVDPNSDDLTSPSTSNPGLLINSEAVRQQLDNWVLPTGIKLYQIAGFGEETLGTVHYWSGKKCVQVTSFGGCSAYEPKLEYTPELVVDGDGTVVAPSALAFSPSGSDLTRWWVDLSEYDSISRLERKHADILEVPQLRDFIKQNILTGISTTLPDFLKDSEPPVDSGKRLKFYLHSPLALSAHDSQGHEISASVSTLPGAHYERFGEVQYISVPAESHPTLALDGEAEGSFTLEVQEGAGNEMISQTTFEAIPTNPETKVAMDFPDGTVGNAEPLIIDYDGNGTPEFSLEPKPGEVVTLPPLDETPPEAKVFFDPVTSTVKVEGIDEGGPVTVTTASSDTKGKKKPEKLKGDLVTTTLTDPSGNTSILTYKVRFPERDRRAALEFVSMSYNGVATSFSDTLLRYKWLQRDGAYRLFAAYMRTPNKRLEAHYRPKQDMTIIMNKPQDLDESDDDSWVDEKLTREKLPGLVVPYLETKEGIVSIKY